MAAELVAGLDRVEASLLPQALGVWSSALCLMLDLRTAAYVNRQALALARARSDPMTVANLLLRRSYIVADSGDHRGA